MSVQYNPTWRYGGNQLKRWRTKASVTREELGAASNYSPDTIKAMEQGVRMPTARVLDAADELCHAEGLLSAAKEYVRAEKFPARAQDFMAREQEAISHWSYELALVPGLLQTAAYACALIGGRRPPLDDATAAERIDARMERQELLTRRPLAAFSFVMYEAVLHCPMGGLDVHKGQLLHLLAMADLPNIELQVLPYDRVISTGLIGPMVLLETPDHERFAYSTGQSMSQLTAEPEVVSAHIERISLIRTVALGPVESAQFIERMAGTL
ncbi:helix-turn-helix transcriptional regulator [Streptomyces sp. NPDC050844]|uniref:helix-turn-helix domain-containing protein n=1 Tax=Streptomyces sp. NPDC050844 TaxID=3155790 RepID=UPI00340A0CEE